MKTINDLYKYSKENNINLLSDYNGSYWSEYITNHSSYDSLFAREYYSFIFFLQNETESISEVLSNFREQVYNHLLINHKRYSELFRISNLSDGDYNILDNVDITEQMNKDTSFDKGQRSDSNSSSLGNQTVNSTNKVSPYDDENFFNDNQNTKTLGARSDSGTYVSGSQHDTGTEDYILTKKGNNGNESPVTLIKKHLDVWNPYEFYSMIFKNIANELLMTGDFSEGRFFGSDASSSFDNLRKSIEGMREDINELKEEVSGVQTDEY